MGGVDVGGGGGGKRKVARLGDQHDPDDRPPDGHHLVPPHHGGVDAHGAHQRGRAGARPPRPDVEQEKTEPEKQLHVEMRGDDKFVLVWKQGARRSISTIDVPRKDVVNDAGHAKSSAIPDLAAKIETRVEGQGRSTRNPTRSQVRSGDPAHRQQDRVQVHHRRHRRDLPDAPAVQLGGKTEKVPAFNITFAVN